jgi:hypothetical protein
MATIGEKMRQISVNPSEGVAVVGPGRCTIRVEAVVTEAVDGLGQVRAADGCQGVLRNRRTLVIQVAKNLREGADIVVGGAIDEMVVLDHLPLLVPAIRTVGLPDARPRVKERCAPLLDPADHTKIARRSA